MIDFAIQLLSSAAISSLLAAAIVWLTKSWISERLKNSIKNEYDEKLETHKAQLKATSDVEIERFKSQLNITAAEHQVKFSRLHDQRAEVIAELYSLLVQAHWDTSSFVSPMEWAGEPNKQEKYTTSMNAIADFFRFFDKNRIYLPEVLCKQIEVFVQEMRKKAIGFGVYVRFTDNNMPDHQLENKHRAWTAAWEYFDNEVPNARSALEHELRIMLGAEIPKNG